MTYYKYNLKIKSLKDFVATEKVVTESARIHVKSVVKYIVGYDYKGSWWSLPQSSLIYNALVQLRVWDKLLVCNLINGRVTYVYFDLWPSLIRVSDELPDCSLSKIIEFHSGSGAHKKILIPTHEWASKELMARSKKLSKEEAISSLKKLIPHPDRFFLDISLRC